MTTPALDILNDPIPSPPDKLVPTDAGLIVEAVALLMRTDVETLLSRRRSHFLFLGRALIAHTMRHATSLTYDDIGRLLGRDHTTIMSSVERIETLRRDDEWVQLATGWLERQFPKKGPRGAMR